MADLPVLFSGPMVRAILAGAKTQTRRIVGPATAVVSNAHVAELAQREAWDCVRLDTAKLGPQPGPGAHLLVPHAFVGADWSWLIEPRVRPGDRLWVRETFAVRDAKAWREHDTSPGMIFYRADDERHHDTDGAWSPSIHMPRWASRITLEATAVRAERLQAITDADATAEGVDDDGVSPWATFRRLWAGINGEDSWAANPWVWVIEFKRAEVSGA